MPWQLEPDNERYDALQAHIRRLEGQLEDALREKATAELQIDRTERSLLASYRDLAQKNEALIQKNVELEQALAAEAEARSLAEEREKLLRQIVHDQRTDLMNIAIAADLAGRQPGSNTPMATIRQSVERIEQFLSEKMAKLRGAAVTAMTPVRPVLADVLARQDELLALRGLSIEASLPSAAVLVPLSEIELAQVVQNLLSNALKHAPHGSVVTCAANVAGDRLIIRVTDEGPGIPPHLLTVIGDGRRADPDQPGYGLGLRNVKALLEPIGGRLTWCNGHVGATFEVDMPFGL